MVKRLRIEIELVVRCRGGRVDIKLERLLVKVIERERERHV